MLLDLTGSSGYKQALKPWLEEKRSKSYPDPTDFKSVEEFTYAAQVASVYKKVIAELLHYLENEIPTIVKDLNNKEKGEVPDFGIGRG